MTTCIATYYASDVAIPYCMIGSIAWNALTEADLIARYCPAWCSLFDVEVDIIIESDDYDQLYLADVAFHVWA